VRIAVSGSIATDHLMTFSGSFSKQLIAERLHHVSLSFLVDELEIRRGGAAANICFGLAALGLRPVLVGSVGPDFEEYRQWLDAHGVDTSGVRVSKTLQTARFICTTDSEQAQIATFYAGAMSEARDIDLDTIGDIDLVVVSPNDPAAMIEHTRYCRDRGQRFAADPSQQLAILEDEPIRELVVGADLLFGNAYEAALLEHKTGWSASDVLEQVGTRVTTRGADGIVIERAGEAAITVPVVPAPAILEPTGVGDAFRAGFFAATSWDLSLERAAQLGALLATWCVESVGPQEYVVDAGRARERLAGAYDESAADEIAAHL